MQQIQSSYRKILFASALAGAFVFSLPSATEAHRLQTSQPQVETKVEMQGVRHVQQPSGVERGIRPTPEGTTRSISRSEPRSSLQERIEAILHPVEEPVPDVMTPLQVPKTVSAYDDSIIGTPLATQEQCVKYLLSYNPSPNISCTPQQLVSFYYQEGEREGIRPDVAFAHALKETGFFRYGGDVVPSQNNY